jgi:chorismate mutase
VGRSAMSGLLRFILPPLLLLGFVLFGGCQSAAPVPPANTYGDPLPLLIAERLAIAREVAWTKYHSGAPVLDPEREAALLSALIAEGRARGLDTARIEDFFTAQIAASREVQTELLFAWAAGAAKPDHAPLDLRADIRPRLDALTPRLLDALPAAPAPDLALAAERLLADAGFSPAVVALAVAPLRR